MRLTRVRLRNVRCLASHEMVLGDGITVLRGHNGAGKSTVIEGIGFALFGAPMARSGTDALGAIPPGASQLEAEVEFNVLGEHYRVRRTLSRKRSQAELTRGDDKQPIARGAVEVDEALARLAQLTGEHTLRALFERLLGVRQGDLLRPFLLPEPDRKSHFAPLLNLDRYAKAAELVTRSGATFQADLARVEEESARTGADIDGYDRLAKRLGQCQREEASAEQRATGVRGELTQLADRARELEITREQIQKLTVDKAILSEGARRATADAERARQRLEQAELAAASLDEMRQAHDRWEELDAECRVIERQQADREALRSEVAELERQLSDARAGIDQQRDALSTKLEESQRRAEEILVERDGLRSYLETLRSRARHLEGMRSAVGMAGERLLSVGKLLGDVAPAVDTHDPATAREEREAERDEQRAEAAARVALAAELQELSARARTEDDARSRVREAREVANRLEKLIAQVQQTMALLAPAMGACPLLKEPCGNLGGESLILHFEQEATRLEGSHNSAGEAVRLAQGRLDEALAAKEALSRREQEERTRERRPRSGTASARSRPGDPDVSPLTRPIAFDEIGHHLSTLSGILGAIDPREAAAHEPVALIGAVAGEGSNLAAPELRIEPPSLALVEETRAIAHEAEAAARHDPRSRRVAELGAQLAARARRLQAQITACEAKVRESLAHIASSSRGAETQLLDSSRALEEMTAGRARIRAATKELSTRDLTLLDSDLALTDRRMRLGTLERLDHEVAGKRQEQETLKETRQTFRTQAPLAEQLEDCRDDWKRLEAQRREAEISLARTAAELEAASGSVQPNALDKIARQRDKLHAEVGRLEESARALQRERSQLAERVRELDAVQRRLEELQRTRDRARAGLAIVVDLAATYRAMEAPVAAVARRQIEAEANRLYRRVAQRGERLVWGEDFQLSVVVDGSRRALSELSKGEQMTAALAVQLALLKQFPEVGILFLDEPTAQLDPGRRQELAAALGEYRRTSTAYLRQILVVSHDDAFDQVADLVVDLSADAGTARGSASSA